MIENLRKYTALMITVFVILFISFLFLDTSSVKNLGSSKAVMKIAGRSYNEKEFQSLGPNSMKLVQMLAGSGDYSLFQFVGTLSPGATGQDDTPEKFFVGRMLLRQAKEKFGVYPSEAEITGFLRTLKAFNGPDQKFNASTYQNFVDRGLGQLGMSEKDLRELASDVLTQQKMNTILGSGLTVDNAIIAKDLALKNQQISGELAKMDLDPFEAKIEPTEEEIKTYWETISDSFTTEPKRKFTYVIATPDLPAETEAEAPEAPETIVDAAASDQDKKAAAKKKEEEKAKRATEKAEERRKKQLELDSLVSDFVDDLEEQKGAGFEELVKANKWEVKTTELFPLSAVPKELDLTVRFSQQGGKAADQLFQIRETSDPLSKISEAIPVAENQWIIARIDEDEKSRPKTYEEARNDARAQYISEKAAEALKAAANENITKIKAAMTAGKSFADAVKEVGIAATTPFTAITSTSTPDTATQPQGLFETARNLDPGSVADVITESDRAFILYVSKREVVKEPNAAARIESEVANLANRNETIAFTSWIIAQVEAAQVEQLYKQ